jgi:hypothetical protein
MSQKLVAEFRKNSAEVVRVHLTEFKGNLYFDVRIWLQEKPGEPGNLKATKKGICLNIELLNDLKQALEKLNQVIEEASYE